MRVKYQLSGEIALLITAALYGLSPLITRVLATQYTSFQQMFSRVAIGYIFALICSRGWRAWGRLDGRESSLVFLRLIFGWGLGYWTFIEASTHTSLGKTALLASLPWLTLWGSVVEGEKITIPTLLRVASLVLGLFFISGVSPLEIHHLGYGETMALVSGLVLAVSQGVQRMHAESLSSVISTRMCLLGASCLFGGGLLFEAPSQPPLLTWSTIGILVLSGIHLWLNSFFGDFGLRKVGAARGSNILALESVFGIGFGWLFYGESLAVHEQIGAAFLIAAALELPTSFFGRANTKSPRICEINS